MAREIEAKLRISDPDAVRVQLRRAGARFTGRAAEQNILFDTQDQSLLSRDCGLRVRSTRWMDGLLNGHVCTTLTFKGPREIGPLKARPEHETTCDDAAALREILGQLGYRPVVAYEKRRETWRVDACEVAIDELPRLGWFVEIEGPSGDEIEQLRSRLGLADAALVPENYVELAARDGVASELAPRSLLFDDAPAQP